MIRVGIVRAIFTAPSKGEPMQSLAMAMAVEGQGLEGDRYALGLGAYSHAKPPKVRHITLIAEEDIQQANRLLGINDRYRVEETRRNLVVQGMKTGDYIGRRFMIGSVLIEGIEPCAPCARPGNLVKKPRFADVFEGRGGLRAAIIEGGMLCAGQTIWA